MAIETEFLNSISYFNGLSSEVIGSIKPLLFEKKYERGEMIIYEDEENETLYIVAAGAVKVFKTSVEGKEQIFGIIMPGDTFNDAAVFDDGTNPASAQAMSETVLYEIGKSELSALVSNHPQIALNAINTLAGKVRDMISLVEDLSFRHVIGRVAKILLEYAGNESGSGPRLTQQEMAAMAGSAREVVGRSLKTLEEEGLIKLNRQKVSITDKEALREMVEEPI